jgi:hypothetical protein
MLFYGNGTYIPEDCKVCNLNSMREGYLRLNYLLPPNSLGFYIDRDFDIAYFNYIFQNDNVFMEFFGIIYELYINNNMFIVVDESEDWSENIAESLFKAIQQRYGYNAYRVNSQQDYLWIMDSSSPPQFNPEWGIYNLDIDKDRYTVLVETARIKAGGKLYYDD